MPTADSRLDRIAAVAGLLIGVASGALGIVSWFAETPEDDPPIVAWVAFWAGLAAGLVALGLIIHHFTAHRRQRRERLVIAAIVLGALVGSVLFIFQTDQLFQDFDIGMRSLVSASSGNTIILGVALVLGSIGLLRDIQLPRLPPLPPPVTT